MTLGARGSSSEFRGREEDRGAVSPSHVAVTGLATAPSTGGVEDVAAHTDVMRGGLNRTEDGDPVTLHPGRSRHWLPRVRGPVPAGPFPRDGEPLRWPAATRLLWEDGVQSKALPLKQDVENLESAQKRMTKSDWLREWVL